MFPIRRVCLLFWLGAYVVGNTVPCHAAVVSFAVDPATIDSNNDGFITGTEFSPIGSDGTQFTMMPTDNLVGGDRFLLNSASGLQFGGGGGSTLSFDFTPNLDITLNSYTISASGFILRNPLFDIREGTNVLSTGNNATPNGLTSNFTSGPLNLTGGTTYSFVTTVNGAAIQSHMGSWDYTTVPEPSCLTLIAGLGYLVAIRRRRSN